MTNQDVDQPSSPGARVSDPETGWDRVSVISALTTAARRRREAEVDQLVLIARAAEVWSWIDNIDAVSDQIRVADHVGDETIRDSIRAVAEAGDDASLDALLGNGADPRALHGERLYRYGAEGSPEVSEFLRLEVGPALGISPERRPG